MKSSISNLKKLLEPIKRSVMLSIARMVVKSINDAGGIQLVKGKLFADVTKDGMERIQNYGFTSVPVSGSEAVVVFPGGNMDHGVVIAIDNRKFRLNNLQPGEVALYTDEGDKIHFKRGRIIDISTHTLNLTATESINIDSPTLNFTASSSASFDTPTLSASNNIAATGNMTCLAGDVSMSDFREKYNTHVHNENGDGGGITDQTTNTI